MIKKDWSYFWIGISTLIVTLLTAYFYPLDSNWGIVIGIGATSTVYQFVAFIFLKKEAKD